MDQELAYLASWLHTRDDLQDALTCHLRAKASRLGLDWSTSLPPLPFARRLESAFAPYAPAPHTLRRPPTLTHVA
ncbi:MAG TPA: hypothetical protein VF916_04385 [Ktedonobacterales bacterium]